MLLIEQFAVMFENSDCTKPTNNLALDYLAHSNHPFLIKNGSVGNLNKEIKMKQIDSIFAEDSIVKINSSPNALETQGEVEIYEKGGKT